MPDSFEHTPTLAIRMPNGALASLAGNIDAHHEVAIADLVLAQSAVRQTVEQLIREGRPDIVGLSVMTFQRATARRIIALIRSLTPEVFIVVGGYDPSLAPGAWTDPALGVDAIVRGEGELTFRELLRALDEGKALSEVQGLWFRERDGFTQTAPRSITAVENGTIAPPKRGARRADRLHDDGAGRSMSSKPRAAARSTAASARSSRCAAATFTASRSRA